MKHEQIASTRQRVNLLIDREVVAEARALGLNLSRTVSQALADEVRTERQRRWRKENQVWTASYNEWFERDGDPLTHLTLP